MSSSSVELTKVGSKVADILTSLAKMLEEDKQKEKELTVSLLLYVEMKSNFMYI